MKHKPSYEEMAGKLADLEEIVRALRSGEVDAVIGTKDVLMLRLREVEAQLKKQRDNAEQLARERSKLIEGLRIRQTQLETQAEALKQSQEKALQQTNRLQTLLDIAPAFIWIAHDAECRRISGNNATYELSRVPKGVNLSKTGPAPEMLTHYRVLKDGKELAPEQMPIQRVAATGKALTDYDLDFHFADGTVRSLMGNVSPLFDADGKINGAIAAFVDITELKRTNQLKDEFIGLVSHEIRTPLTVVIGSVNTAMDERISREELRELLKEANSSAESLASIVDNLLEISRYQAGRLVLDKELADVSEIARRTLDKVQQHYPSRDATIDIPDKLPLVFVDPGRLERIIYNLVENAFKYSPVGSEVRIFTRQEKEGLSLRVSDHGEGIRLEDQQKIFEPFVRVGAATNKIKGVGLGLVVCKRLVEAHGGRIWVESRAGEGSTFLFTIPRSKQTRT